MHVVWRVQKVTLDLASVRYRALLPCASLTDAGVSCTLTATADKRAVEKASHVVIVKAFTPADIELAQHAKSCGKHVYFDLCDNVFVNGYGKSSALPPARALEQMAESLTAIVVPTQALAQAVRRALGSVPVAVIPDGLEDAVALSKQRQLVSQFNGQVCARSNVVRNLLESMLNRLRPTSHALPAVQTGTRLIVWFGNHGSPWSNFGLSDILLFREPLEQLALERSIVLVVVSNNRGRYEQEIRPIAVPSIYLEWTPEVLHDVLRQADVVIAPNSGDEFSLCKSSNRTVMALVAGVPVVASPTHALEQLRDCVWLDDPLTGLRRYLDDRKLKSQHLKCARRLMAMYYAAPVIGGMWKRLLQGQA
jgi:hypothetical protein